MIQIFKGKWRGPAGKGDGAYMKIEFGFRQILHQLKGARLHVFMAIMLHADEDGVCYPSYNVLEKETGYGRSTIAQAIKDLCSLSIDGTPILHKWRARNSQGQFEGSNCYIIFPTEAEMRAHEASSPDTQSSVSPQLEKSNGGKIVPEPEPVCNQNQRHKPEPDIGSAKPTPSQSAKPTAKRRSKRRSQSFPKDWYTQMGDAYQEIKGIQLSGDGEWLPFQQQCKTIFMSGHAPDDAIALMRALEESDEEWTSNWTIKTVRMKLAEFKAGKLRLGPKKRYSYERPFDREKTLEEARKKRVTINLDEETD